MLWCDNFHKLCKITGVGWCWLCWYNADIWRMLLVRLGRPQPDQQQHSHRGVVINSTQPGHQLQGGNICASFTFIHKSLMKTNLDFLNSCLWKSHACRDHKWNLSMKWMYFFAWSFSSVNFAVNFLLVQLHFLLMRCLNCSATPTSVLLCRHVNDTGMFRIGGTILKEKKRPSFLIFSS